MPVNSFLLFFFWFIFSLLTYTYIVYPILIWLLGEIKFIYSEPESNYKPSVTLLIAAYNESAIIKKKIENSLALDYPSEKLDIVVVSDGSTDDTEKVVNEFNLNNVSLHKISKRVGKTEAQNRGVKKSRGEIIVFSDANAMYEPDAILQLVKHFIDDSVGCVSGKLSYAESSSVKTTAEFEKDYWQIEQWMKSAESKLSILTGANGSIYAVRRESYVKLNADIISDFIEPLLVVLNGKKFLYEPLAVSLESSSKNLWNEFKRKRRIVKRSIHGLLQNKRLLNPARVGFLSIALISHKVLRWLTPIFVIFLVISSSLLMNSFFYSITFYSIVVLFSLGIVGILLPSKLLPNFIGSLAYLVAILVADLLALLETIFGRVETYWTPKR